MMRIGCDPELVFISPEGRLVPADNLLSGGTSAPFGTDGNSRVAELRPAPAEEPREVVENLRQLMKAELERNQKIKAVKWFAGGYVGGLSIGGHIHFECKPKTEILKVLDGVLSQVLILIEDESEARSRRNRQYGQLRDYETKPWGFEYRTPASWLTSPGVALATLSLAKTVVAGVERREINFSPEVERLLEVDHVVFRQAERDYFLLKFKQIWKLIGNFSLAKKYWPEISRLKQLVQSGKSWSNGQDIRARWKLEQPAKQILARPAEQVWQEVQVD